MYVSTVYAASNGDEAIDIFNNIGPNIIITDFKMPSTNGLELTTHIRKTNKDIPIVVISAYTDKKALVEFTALNLVKYLVKPVGFEELDRVLEECAKELIENGLFEVKLNDTTLYSFSQKCIIRDDQNISLAPNEIKFLELLLNNRKKLVSNEMIEYEVYNSEAITDAALNNLVSKLRKKIGLNNIKNISKTGYIFIN